MSTGPTCVRVCIQNDYLDRSPRRALVGLFGEGEHTLGKLGTFIDPFISREMIESARKTIDQVPIIFSIARSG